MEQEVRRAIKERRSIRVFVPTPLAAGQIEKLVQSVRWAPSAGNLQSRRFYFVLREESRKALAAFARQEFVAAAPLVVVACLDRRIVQKYGARGEQLYAICDTAMAVEDLLLTAYSMGLGGCVVGAFDEDEVAKYLRLPAYLRPIMLVPLGHPAEAPPPPPRLSREAAVKIVT
jgi:nitroreductase